MYTRQEIYCDKTVDILYPEEGYVLQHKITKMKYGAVSLEDGRKKEDYDEIEEIIPSLNTME